MLDKLKRAKKPVLLIGSQALYLPSHNPNYTPSSLQVYILYYFAFKTLLKFKILLHSLCPCIITYIITKHSYKQKYNHKQKQPLKFVNFVNFENKRMQQNG